MALSTCKLRKKLRLEKWLLSNEMLNFILYKRSQSTMLKQRSKPVMYSQSCRYDSATKRQCGRTLLKNSFLIGWLFADSISVLIGGFGGVGPWLDRKSAMAAHQE